MQEMPIIKKRWRELPKNKKLNLPINHFKINQKEIRKIRKIENRREKLIKAAKLQYELYGNIHSYLTAWIAGYLSDSTIRNEFVSTKNLLELFYNTSLNNKNINQSWADIKRKIKIPQDLTKDLAEEIGIHIGDGNLYIFKSKEGFKSYKYTINGHLNDEYLYHTEHIRKLLINLYNYPGFIMERSSKSTIETNLKSKAVVEFKNKILKLPIGPKYNIKIPSKILEDKELSKRCLVGIFDTDFTLNDNVNIVGTLTSIKVIKQMHKILTALNIKHSLLFKKNFGKIRISKEGSIKILEEWQLNNPKHTSKYDLWKEFNKFIPFSRTEERLAVISGKLNFNDLKRICNKRKKSPNGARILNVSR